MKKLILSSLLIFSFFLARAQDKQAILNLMHQQELAWNKADVEGFMQGYWKSDSLLFVGSKGPVYGWQTTLDGYKKRYPGKAAMGQLKFTILQVKVLDATNAFVLGGWHLKRIKGDMGGYYTLWFRKIKGEWKIVCDHTS
ncbi:MAG TPA: nuclear transport factor 2 family protein [Mucilaginibacter sp.]